MCLNYSQQKKNKVGLARTVYRSQPPPADNSDVFFITGKTDHLSCAPKYTKPSGGEERLLIGLFQIVKTLKISHFIVEVKPKGMEIWKFRRGKVY